MEGQKQTMEKKVAVNIFKREKCFSGRPTSDAGKTLPWPEISAQLTFIPFPFIARAFKVFAVRTSVLLVVFTPCYENSNKIRRNVKSKTAHV